MATGTAVIDFGSTPNAQATVPVTGLTGLSSSSHLEAFMQGGDTSSNNTATDHKLMSMLGSFNCTDIDSGSFNIECNLIGGLATGQFTVHYATA